MTTIVNREWTMASKRAGWCPCCDRQIVVGAWIVKVDGIGWMHVGKCYLALDEPLPEAQRTADFKACKTNRDALLVAAYLNRQEERNERWEARHFYDDYGDNDDFDFLDQPY